MSHARQLAAIMFTDIEGYTALMQQNENNAIQVRNKHRQVFNSITERHKGKILQYYGDGTLSIFNSAIDAVKCGIEMQLEFQNKPSIPVRIGIHTGDIIFSEEEIIGDSVNVASRIESLSVPGSVFISDKVYDEIKNQDTIQASMLKTFKLKNVKKPIAVYAISNVGLIVPKIEIEGSATKKNGSITSDRLKSGGQKGGTPILSTKLYIPPPRSRVVLRQRLIEKLDEGLQSKLTLISAPAGFGKTTLAAEWISCRERPFAWLSLDEEDNDPIRFVAYMIAALQTISVDMSKGASEILQSSQQPTVDSVLTVLLNGIGLCKEPFTLVLDDYHVIKDEAIHKVITFVLDHQPPQMHLLITTRTDPPLPLPRLRVRGQLRELRVADLRFTPSESAEFLNNVMGLNLSSENIATLEVSTEGWVAGLQLAALSMQGRQDIPAFINAFAGDNRYIVDYLVEEVLQSQPDHVRDFLMQTSILNRLRGALCDAVTNKVESNKMLDSLERGNLFVVPLDDNCQWYRYHHLFADVLRTRLLEEQPELVSTLHLRASEWFEENNQPEASIRHAILAKDFERAADLIELAWPAMDRGFQSATWLGWIKTIPEELISVKPVLSVDYAWALLMDGKLEGCEDRLQDAERWLSLAADKSDNCDSEMRIADEEQFQALPASIATARAYLAGALGDVPATIKYAHQALDLFEDDHYMRSAPTALLGLSCLAIGDLDAAHRSFTDVIDIFLKNRDVSLATGMTYILADIRIVQGRLHEAVRTYERSLQLAAEQGDLILRGVADLYLGLSELHHEQGNIAAARQQLQRTEELSGEAKLADWPYCWCLAKARIKKAQGDLTGAINLLDEANQIQFMTPMPDIRPISALKTRIWIEQGKLMEANEWVSQQNLSSDDDLSYLHEFEHITLTRVLIALYKGKGEARSIYDALKLLDRLLKAAEEGGRKGSMIEILILQGLAHEAQANIAPALVLLKRALTLAEPENYVRIFVDEGNPMARLLNELTVQGFLPRYTDKLLAVFEKENKSNKSRLAT